MQPGLPLLLLAQILRPHESEYDGGSFALLGIMLLSYLIYVVSLMSLS
ncbi:MAG: hypothetical protein IPM39_19910 [Chloroflexi bacterium]|nr:hypothetical protein [Chloroflexota bacterium]